MITAVTATYKDCRCFHYYPEYQEEIHDTSILDNSLLKQEVYLPVDTGLCLDKVKKEAICDFETILTQLECGIQPNLEDLLEKLSLIDINEDNCNL